MEVGPSAHRHGIAVEDMAHAVNHVLGAVEHDDGMTMLLGPDRAGRFLEVGFSELRGEPVIVHAMAMRPKYERFL
jgi:hypothetical protein